MLSTDKNSRKKKTKPFLDTHLLLAVNSGNGCIEAVSSVYRDRWCVLPSEGSSDATINRSNYVIYQVSRRTYFRIKSSAEASECVRMYYNHLIGHTQHTFPAADHVELCTLVGWLQRVSDGWATELHMDTSIWLAHGGFLSLISTVLEMKQLIYTDAKNLVLALNLLWQKKKQKKCIL